MTARALWFVVRLFYCRFMGAMWTLFHPGYQVYEVRYVDGVIHVGVILKGQEVWWRCLYEVRP